jgi:hypothetical protein
LSHDDGSFAGDALKLDAIGGIVNMPDRAFDLRFPAMPRDGDRAISNENKREDTWAGGSGSLPQRRQCRS